MPDLIPDAAVEAAARALCELDGGNPDSRATEWVDGHWTTRASDPAWTYYTVEAHAALTAAAPLIAAQATADPDHWAHAAIAAQDAALTAQINEAVKWGREKDAELSDLRARIEALRDEWRAEAATAECNGHALDRQHMYDGARAERLYAMTMQRHADALDALLRERAS